jgi:hypothetical protein
MYWHCYSVRHRTIALGDRRIQRTPGQYTLVKKKGGICALRGLTVIPWHKAMTGFSQSATAVTQSWRSSTWRRIENALRAGSPKPLPLIAPPSDACWTSRPAVKARCGSLLASVRIRQTLRHVYKEQSYLADTN